MSLKQALRLTSAIWGVIGVVAMLSYAVSRLAHHAMDLLEHELELLQWVALIANVLFMAYSEGYKGFQKSFAPRVAARARYLMQEANLVNGLLAPAFCLGYFGTTTKRRVSVLILTLMIVCLVAIVSKLDQPWRGIVDAGVVVGLMWGIIAVVLFSISAFTQESFPHSPELAVAKST